MLAYFSHTKLQMYNKETGMPDQVMTKTALQWFDRLIKADTKNTSAFSNASRKKKDAADEGTMF
jgi:hypothetical protein